MTSMGLSCVIHLRHGWVDISAVLMKKLVRNEKDWKTEPDWEGHTPSIQLYRSYNPSIGYNSLPAWQSITLTAITIKLHPSLSPLHPSPSGNIHCHHGYMYIHLHQVTSNAITVHSSPPWLHPLPSSYIHRHQVTSNAIRLHPSPSSYIHRHQVTSITTMVTSIAIKLHPSPSWLHPLPSAPLYPSPSSYIHCHQVSYIHRHQVTSTAIKLVTSIAIRLHPSPSGYIHRYDSYIHRHHCYMYIHRHQVTHVHPSPSGYTCTSIAIRLHMYIHRHQVTSIAIMVTLYIQRHQVTSNAIRLHPSPSVISISYTQERLQQML